MLIVIRKAQSTLEYAALIGIVAAAVVTSQNVVKRAIQGKLKSVSDSISDPYSPGLTKYFETTNASSTTNSIIAGKTTTMSSGTQSKTLTGYNVKPLAKEWWPE